MEYYLQNNGMALQQRLKNSPVSAEQTTMNVSRGFQQGTRMENIEHK